MLDPLFSQAIQNEKYYTKVSTKRHTVKFCLPDLNQAFTNKLLGITFRTTTEKPFVVDYADGDYRPMSFSELSYNYCLIPPRPLTLQAIEEMAQAGGSLIEWTPLTTTEYGEGRIVLASRVSVANSFPYKIGDTLYYINDKSVKHDKGDVLLATKQAGRLIVIDVINGETFKRLFNNRTQPKIIGNLTGQRVTPKVVSQSSGKAGNKVVKARKNVQSQSNQSLLNDIQQQAKKAACVLMEASRMMGKVVLPAVSTVSCYPQYLERIAFLWQYVAKFIKLLDNAYAGFCTKEESKGAMQELLPAQITCKEVAVNEVTYGIEMTVVSPLNGNNPTFKLLHSTSREEYIEKTEFVWRFMFTVSNTINHSDRLNDNILHFEIDMNQPRLSCALQSKFIICGEQQATELKISGGWLYLHWGNMFNPALDDTPYPPVETIHELIRKMTVALQDKRLEYEKIRVLQLGAEERERRRQNWENRKNKIKGLFKGNKAQQLLLSDVKQIVSVKDVLYAIQELETVAANSKNINCDVEAGNPRALASLSKDLSAIVALWIYLRTFIQFLNKTFDKSDVLEEDTQEYREEQALLNSIIATVTVSDYVLDNQYGVTVCLFCSPCETRGSFRLEFNFSVEKGRLGISKLPYFCIRSTTPPVYMTTEVVPIVNGEPISVIHSKLWGTKYSPYTELSLINWGDFTVERSIVGMPAAVKVMRKMIVNTVKQYKTLYVMSLRS